ncbi:hypothetical protein Phage2-1_00082 [Achromobacter phage 2-1]|nr:hypothetical protein Phage2-1_00082 [Achromobacter phage 2-1]
MPRSPSALHKNAGQPWSEADDHLLVVYWEAFHDIKYIGRLLGRSDGSITSRLHRRHAIEWWLGNPTLTQKPELNLELKMNPSHPLVWSDHDQKLLDTLTARKQAAEQRAAEERNKRYAATVQMVSTIAPRLTEVSDGEVHDYLAQALLGNSDLVMATLGPTAALAAAGSPQADALLSKAPQGFVCRQSAIRRVHHAMNQSGGSFTYAAATRALDAMVDIGLITNHARASNQ